MEAGGGGLAAAAVVVLAAAAAAVVVLAAAAAAWSEVRSRSSRSQRYIVHKIPIPDLHLRIFRCSHSRHESSTCFPSNLSSCSSHSSKTSQELQEAYLEAGLTVAAAAAAAAVVVWAAAAAAAAE